MITWQIREQLRLEAEIKRAVHHCLFERDDWVLGVDVDEFEKEFSSFLGSPYGVGVSSGTDALVLAILALNIGPGDSVIVPALTYISTGLAVIRAGAHPVFADIEPERWTLDPASVEAVTRKNDCRAMIPVHLYGRAAAMPELTRIAHEKNLLVVEDACQGHGAVVNGRMVGTIGDAGCFSFFPTKTLGACGDAGFVATKSPEVAERVRIMRTPGRLSPQEQRLQRHNHRLDSVQAAILRVKLRYLNESIARRRALLDRITSSLDALGLCLGLYADDAPTELVLIAPERDNLLNWLRSKGIKARVHWPTILSDLPVFERYGQDGSWPVSQLAARALLGVPIHPEMTDDEADEIADQIRAFYGA